MKRKNGFTLIELLAIIVILAIIALIAIPVVLNIIDKVRVASYARSADNILDGARIYQKEALIDSTMSIEGNNYDKVMENIGGRKPNSGEIYIKKNGEIALALKYDKYCYKKGYSDVGITQTESEDCSLAAELDENAPIITAKEESVTIEQGTSNEIINYFNIDSNGASGIKETVCKNSDTLVTNTSTLTVGTHTITCTVTKNNEKSANATVTIIVEEKELTAEDIVENLGLTTVTTGDGLYLDSDGIYRYKGSNPNNYIMLGEEEYRILAIEKQGVKVVRSSELSTKYEFDVSNNRPTETNTYCTSGYCNIWAKTSEIKQNGEVSDTITNGDKTGTVTANSTAYTVLHDTYYSNLSSIDSYIVKDATWNVGPVTYSDPMLLSTVKEEESKWTWQGKIGLLTVSEHIQAQLPSSSSYSTCINDVYDNVSCGNDNWMRKIQIFMHTMTPQANTPNYLWFIGEYTRVSSYGMLSSNRDLVPVVYLKSNIELTGNGTKGENAFQIIGTTSE